LLTNWRVMRNRNAWPLILLAGVLSCGGGSGGGAAAPDGGGGGEFVSCLITEVSGSLTLVMMCFEGTGIYADQVRLTCSQPSADAAVTPQATISSAPCSRANALGACMLTTGAGSLTTWRYPDSVVMTTADVAATCVGPQTFISP
jgi:hypothetical protein